MRRDGTFARFSGVSDPLHTLELKPLHLPADAAIVAVSGSPEPLASTILCCEEQAFFARLQAVETRRTEWLLGRYAAKEAAIRSLQRRGRPNIEHRAVQVRAAENGKPHLHGPDCERLAMNLSHAQGLAVAVVWPVEHGPAGIDVEFERALSPALVASTFTAHELALAEPLTLWCVKEAVAKATGDGIRHRLRNITVLALEKKWARVECAGRGFAVELLGCRGATIAVACQAT